MSTDVTVVCNVCGHKIKVPIQELKEEAAKNSGFYPCRKCGSFATDWHFGEDGK